MVNLDGEIETFVTRRTHELYNFKSSLAMLRRGVGKKLGDIPNLLEYVMLPGNDESCKMQQAEKAVYTAITLYAFHQQGSAEFVGTKHNAQGEAGEENSRKSFGAAVKQLVSANQDNKNAVTRRLDQVLTSKDLTELAIHARALIGQMKQAGIHLDYGMFAKDLFWFQQPDYRRNVILKWGKDYYRYTEEEKENGK